MTGYVNFPSLPSMRRLFISRARSKGPEGYAGPNLDQPGFALFLCSLAKVSSRFWPSPISKRKSLAFIGSARRDMSSEKPDADCRALSITRPEGSH